MKNVGFKNDLHCSNLSLKYGSSDMLVEGPFRRRLWEMLESTKAVEEECDKVKLIVKDGHVRNNERSTKAQPDSSIKIWRVPLVYRKSEPLQTCTNKDNDYDLEYDGNKNVDCSVSNLRIIEEKIGMAGGPIHCEHCNCAGWSSHPVCSRQYHFIIPQTEKAWKDMINKQCKKITMKDETTRRAHTQRRGVRLSGMRTCRKYSPNASSNKCFEQILSNQTHLLHGVLHSNGYGHLLRLNGREGGSNALDGKTVMSFWDKLCNDLHAREVTVQDVSRKHGIDLRILHSVMHAKTWYGEWGYNFHKGSFGCTIEMWKQSVEIVNKLTIKELQKELDDKNLASSDFNKIVSKYLDFRCRKATFASLLFQMLTKRKVEIAEAHRRDNCKKSEVFDNSKDSEYEKLSLLKDDYEIDSYLITAHHPQSIDLSILERFTMNKNCRWHAKRVQFAVEVVINVLLNSKKWLPRQHVREKARGEIGDTGLLDFVLKSLSNKIYENVVVVREFNQATKIYEYCASNINGTIIKKLKGKENSKSRFTNLKSAVPLDLKVSKELKKSSHLKKAEQIRSDMKLIYDSVSALREVFCTEGGRSRIHRPKRKGESYVVNALQVLLDCKLFKKDYTRPAPIVAPDHLAFISRKTIKGLRCNVPVSNKNGVICVFSKLVLDNESKSRAPPYPLRAEKRGGIMQTRTCSPPPELIYLPSDATIGDLKDASVTAFHELYEIFNKFTPLTVEGIDSEINVTDSCPLGPAPAGATYFIRGSGANLQDDFSRQGGITDWVVRCRCGIVDDDGERFVSCDICDIWEHTRCSGIPDEEPVPVRWVCATCRKTKRKKLV